MRTLSNIALEKGHLVLFGRKAAAVSIRVLVPAGLLLAGCSGGGAAPRVVEIDGIAFLPDRIEIDAGTEVTWTNHDDVLHTVTSGRQAEQGIPGVSDGTSARPDGTFDARLDGARSGFTFTFERPGTYDYYCSVHVGMVGRVIAR